MTERSTEIGNSARGGPVECAARGQTMHAPFPSIILGFKVQERAAGADLRGSHSANNLSLEDALLFLDYKLGRLELLREKVSKVLIL